MIEHPLSTEALKIAVRFASDGGSIEKCAAEIDALIARRVSAETERCAALVKPSMAFQECVYREAQENPEVLKSISSADDFIRLALTGILRREFREVERAIRDGIRAPAERPAPEGPNFATMQETERKAHLPRRIGVEQPTQETGQPGCGPCETKEQTHRRYYDAFHAWFMQSGCDFWSECDAPESLATIAVELHDDIKVDIASTGEQPEGGDMSTDPICPQDWRVLLQSLIHFGRSTDGAVERDLYAAIERAIGSASPSSPAAVVDYTERAREVRRAAWAAEYIEQSDEIIAAALSAVASEHQAAPIPMVLFCPSCGLQHIDKTNWDSPPHRTHQCHGCCHLWRPATVYTEGVADVPLGTSDTRPAIRERAYYKAALLARLRGQDVIEALIAELAVDIRAVITEKLK